MTDPLTPERDLTNSLGPGQGGGGTWPSEPTGPRRHRPGGLLPATVVLREVTPEEYKAVGDLLVDSYDGIPGAESDPEYNQDLRDLAARVGHSEVLVAVDEACEVVGTITYLPGLRPLSEVARYDDEAEVMMFAVSAAARGRGVGRLLLEACLDRARQQGLKWMWLSTSPWMTDAQRLYEASGFRRIPDRDHTEFSSGQDFHLLAYRRPL